MRPDVIVVGAGIAGLACAESLAKGGARVVVLEASRGLGGRCATWRHEDQPIDYGLTFLHGSDPEFLAEIESPGAGEVLSGWPAAVRGEGPPCQPAAFAPRERRLAYAQGLTCWPKRMARGLDVRLRTRVVSLRVGPASIVATCDGGQAFEAREAVLGLPADSARILLEKIEDPPPGVRSAAGLLGLMTSMPCLTVMAAYPPESPAPAWDLHYPEESAVLQVMAHDAAKRRAPRFRTLVLQARPAWSRDRLAVAEASWAREILEEAGRLAGPWARAPLWWKGHRWRYARADTGSELASPMRLGEPGGPRIGIAGEIFAPGGGVQAAWLSGRRLAARMRTEA